MTKVQTIAVILALIFSVTAAAQSQQTARGNKIEPLPRDLEIQLRSARSRRTSETMRPYMF